MLKEERDEDNDFIKLSEYEIIEAINQEAREKALKLMLTHLEEYKETMKKKATFKGWIAHICPENVKLDIRLDRIDTEWNKLWSYGKI